MEAFKEWFEAYKIPIALCLVGIVLIIGGLVATSKPQTPNSKSSGNSSLPKESIISNTEITVDVSGAVQTPGVYKLSSGARIKDAVLAAGGFREEANSAFVSKYLNLAQKVSDGGKIYIPYKGEKDTDLAVSQNVAGVSSQNQININTSSKVELEALSGIGPVSAQKIIDNRPYTKTEDLLTKKVIGKSTYEKIKGSIVY